MKDCYLDNEHCDTFNSCEETCKCTSECCSCVPCCTGEGARCAKLKPNCKTECCSPIVCENSDIESAKCIPIMAERILDYNCMNNTQFGESDEINGQPIKIIIDNYDPTTMISGMPICIDKVSVFVSSIGIADDTLPFKVGQQNPVYFTAVTGSGELNTQYQAIVTTNCSCGNCFGTKTRVASTTPLIFSGQDLRVVVTGRIGCTCFVGHLSIDQPYVINGNVPGIYPMSVFTKICLPRECKNVTLSLSFTPCVSIDCVIPDPSYVITESEGVATFNVSAEYSFSVDTEITDTVTEKLGVFVSSGDISCSGGPKSRCKCNEESDEGSISCNSEE